jgi:putative transposase
MRGNNRRRLFSYPHEYRQFLFLLGLALAFRDCTLQALVLMTNHIHLILTPFDEDALSRFVKRVAQRYAQTRNQRRLGSGRLFEERFFSDPLISTVELSIVTAYIELNPVRAGLVSRPEDYRWSTYALHAGLETSEVSSSLWTPSSWYLSLDGDPDARAARYCAWVAECRAAGTRPTRTDARMLAVPPPGDRRRVERPNRKSAA